MLERTLCDTNKLMELLLSLADFLLHLDRYLLVIANQYGLFIYLIIFLIIFFETGLVVTPFLPGDSLLFASGALAALGQLRIDLLFALVAAAAIVGDTVNYHIGRLFGSKIVFRDDSRFFKKKYLDRTHAFYEKYGAKTIVLARFVPFVRTFAPFVAGVGRMSYRRFLAYNILGGLLWSAIFVFGGYWFGNLEIVRRNFSLLILIIIFVSLLPGLAGYLRHRRAKSLVQK